MPQFKFGEQAARPLHAIDSVRTRLSVVLALAMLPVLAFSLASAISDLYDRSAAIEHELQDKARIVSKELDSTFASTRQVLYIAQAQAAVRNNFQPACTQFLQSTLAGLPQFANITTISSHGRVLCSASPLDKPVFVARESWFQTALKDKNFILGGPVQDDASGDFMLVAAKPIRLDNAADSRVIAVSIRAEFVGNALAMESTEENVRLLLIDSGGKSLLPGQDTSTLPPQSDLPTYLAAEETVFYNTGQDGIRRLYTSVRLDRSDVYVLLSRPALAASLAVITELLGDVAAMIILFAVTLLIVWLATERMSIRWVRHLRAVAIAQRRGMQGARARGLEKAPIEYRELGAAFNSMADAMERRQATLIQSIAERELLLKEIHHRVKNNLQIIISLFNLNARNTTDERERAHLRSMQVRVESLALVHHAAYQSEDLDLIPMNEFLPTLLEHTERVLEDDASLIILPVEANNIPLTMDQSVPLAQLILEVISSIRLTAPQDVPVELTVSFKRIGPGRARLSIAADIDGTLSDGDKRVRLSRSLVGAFAKQLHGELTTSPDFTNVTVDMPFEEDTD